MGEDDHFRKVQALDEPELVAARWWRDSQHAASRGPDLSRRGALLGLAGLAAASSLTEGCFGGGGSDVGEVTTAALELQRKHGWDFGAEGSTLSMGAGAGDPVDPSVLAGLAKSLAPTNPAHAPFASLVLFDSLNQSAAATTDLKTVIRPIATPEMENAELAGRGLSTLFEGAPAGKAVVVDLPGEQSVAFAAGLANRFDPVFVFDNWPHPRGVVPSHRTLAAAIHLQPTFTEMAKSRPATAPPAFVLDATRLNEFTEASFDNRYVAGMPAPEAMKKLGITELLLVRPKETDSELDDLNHLFDSYLKVGIPVRLVPLERFLPVPEGTKVEVNPQAPAPTGDAYATGHTHHHYHHYGGLGYHWGFWALYAWGMPRYGFTRPTWSAPTYAARPRATRYGRTARPTGFGTMNVDRNGSRPTLSRTQTKSGPMRSGGSSGGSWGRSGSGGSSS